MNENRIILEARRLLRIKNQYGEGSKEFEQALADLLQAVAEFEALQKEK